jgi:hypothetical protein
MSKTIIDAIKGLRGDLNNSYEFNKEEDNFLFWDVRGAVFTSFVYPKRYPNKFIDVCSVDDFESEVRRMSLNFGKCTPMERNNYYLAKKEKLEVPQTGIDWDKAPEGVTHYILGKGDYDNSDFVIEEEDRYTGVSTGISYWLKEELIGPNGFEVTKRPEAISPTDFGAIPDRGLIFTQEMYDNGELPSVGMECLAVYGSVGGLMANTQVVIAHINDKGQFACIDSKGDYLIQYISEDSAESFKPLTPPKTDREILFDQINAMPRLYIEDASKLVDKIINGDLHGVTWGKL